MQIAALDLDLVGHLDHVVHDGEASDFVRLCFLVVGGEQEAFAGRCHDGVD